MRRGIGLTFVLLLLATAACGSSHGNTASTTTGPQLRGKPLTDAQANTLAQVLFRDYQAGGASFEADLPAAGQVVAKLIGDVDWVGAVASADYGATNGTAQTVPYVWNPKIVLDGGIRGLEQAMAAQGHPGITWISRPLDPTNAALDGILALVLTMASSRPGNPQLIAQADTGYMGRSTIDGSAVDGLRFGNITYYVGVSDGLIHELSAHFRSYSDPVVVHLSKLGHRTIHSPQKATVVDASTIPDIYRRLTGHPAPTASSPAPVAPTSTTGG